MKTISSAMDAHLDGAVTTLCTCWKITREDKQVIGFTDHDADLTIGGVLYKASSGYYRSAISNSADSSVDNLDVSGFLDDDSLNETELRNGAYDYATVEVFAVNWADLSQGIIRLRYGLFGEVMIVSSGFFKVELRGLTQLFSQTIVETYSPECRADLGDERCKVPLMPPVRRSASAYDVGDRVIVPQVPGVSFSLPIKNPGFEINYANAWANPTGGIRTTNLPWEDYDPFAAQDMWYHEPTTASGSVRYNRSLANIGGALAIPTLEVATFARVAGAQVRLTLYWGNSLAASAGGDFQKSSAWIDIPVGEYTINDSVVPSLPYSPNTSATNYAYYVIEWQGAAPGDFRFIGSPKNGEGDIIPQATLTPRGLPVSTVVDWTLSPGNSQVSGPNVWMSPINSDWMLEMYPSAGATAWAYQDVPFEGAMLDFVDEIDDGLLKLRVDVKAGAETVGISSFISYRFFNAANSLIGVAEQEPVYQYSRGNWGDFSYIADVPPGTRSVRIQFNAKNVSDNSLARAVWDTVRVRVYEDSYENQDNYLSYGGVEFLCTQAGITDNDPPEFDYTRDVVTVDGTVQWTAVEPLHMFVTTITEVTNAKRFKVAGITKPDEWFEWGVVEMLNGKNLKKKLEIASWDGEEGEITLALRLPYVPEVGDKLRMHTGCAKSRAVCHEKFNNIINYRGEPDLPGTDQYFKIGGANSGGSAPPGFKG